MKKSIFALFFLQLISIFSLFSQNFLPGRELSNKVFNTYNQKNLNIRTQNLVVTGDNQFPYNITISFNNRFERRFATRQLLLVIDQEQAINNQRIIKPIIDYLKNLKTDCNITILFSYGDKQLIEKNGMLHGTELYLQNFTTGDYPTALILDFENKANKIISSSRGTAAPSYLIKNAYNKYLKNKLTDFLPSYFVSQQTKFRFFKDNQLDYFFNQEIPAIKLCFNKPTFNTEKTVSIIQEFLEEYLETPTTDWDQHFIIFLFGNKYTSITETTLIQMIIVLFFVCVIFFFVLTFVNNNLKTQTWNKIKKIWFSLPITFTIILLSFYVGKALFLIFFNGLSIQGKVCALFSTQLITTLLFTSLYFIFQIHLEMEAINEKSIDFLIVFSSLLNQVVFTFIDISLFSLLMIVMSLSILILIFRKRFFHIIIFILMIINYVPYMRIVLYRSDFVSFSEFFIQSNAIFIIESMILTPIILTYLRILTSYRTKLQNYKRLFITTSTTLAVVSISLIVTACICTSKLKKSDLNEKVQTPVLQTAILNKTNVNYEDKKVFEDKLRTLKINFSDSALVEQCELKISTTGASPILYSDNDYQVSSPTEAYFLIPYRPSGNLTFTYGIEVPESTIDLSIVYYSKEADQFYTENITLETGSLNE